MRETTVKVRQARAVPVPCERAWSLLASPAVWSLRPGQFSFVVALPDGAGPLRVVLTVGRSGRLVSEVFQVSEEVPGQSLTLRRVSGPHPGDLALCLSVIPSRRGTKIAMTAQERVGILGADGRQDDWQLALSDWVAECAAVLTGHRPPTDDGLPADVALACTVRHPAQDASDAVSASASTLVSAPPDRVWRLLRDPAISLLVDPDRVAAGDLPGTTGRRQTGDVKYVIRRPPGGGLRASLIDIQEQDEGRTLLVRDVASGAAYAETCCQVEPDRNGTRLALTTRVLHPAATALQRDLDARIISLTSRYKAAIEGRLT